MMVKVQSICKKLCRVVQCQCFISRLTDLYTNLNTTLTTAIGPMGGFEMSKISAFMHGRDVLVWNVDAVISLDKDWRICSGLIGALPRQPRQNAQLGLPLKLSPEQTTLLIEKGVLELLDYVPPTEENAESFHQRRQQEYEQQFATYLEKREKARQLFTSQHTPSTTIIPQSSEVTPSDQDIELEDSKPKRAKLMDQLSPKEDFRKHKSFSPLVTIHTSDPRPCSSYTHHIDWNYPVTNREKERYAVYKDLWDRGYTLTSGLKYGGDYLVYKGHPHVVHSSYIAVVLPWKQAIRNMVSLCRIGTKVKKSVLLCGTSDGDTIRYLTLQWNM